MVLRDMDVDIDSSAQEAFLTSWRRLYGEPSAFVLEMAHRFLHAAEPGEPYLMVILWAFLVTPPGWSAVVEGYHFPRLDAVRGVVSTDSFHALAFVFRMYEGRFEIPRGSRIARAIPLPRTFVHPEFRLRPLDSAP